MHSLYKIIRILNDGKDNVHFSMLSLNLCYWRSVAMFPIDVKLILCFQNFRVPKNVFSFSSFPFFRSVLFIGRAVPELLFFKFQINSMETELLICLVRFVRSFVEHCRVKLEGKC